MFSRINPMNQGTLLPRDWVEDIESLLEESYEKNLRDTEKVFFVMGRTYPNELWAAFCLLPRDNKGLPVTYNVSIEVQEEFHSKKILSSLFDSAGMFFDSYFANVKNWNDYNPNWSRTATDGVEFFYCVTRENLKLSAQAESLLS